MRRKICQRNQISPILISFGYTPTTIAKVSWLNNIKTGIFFEFVATGE
jgi:hypothetical protein